MDGGKSSHPRCAVLMSVSSIFVILLASGYRIKVWRMQIFQPDSGMLSAPGTRTRINRTGARTKHGPFRAVVRFLGPVLVLALQLSTQQLAVLNVTVTDPLGSVISQARITLRNMETDARRTDLSSGVGSQFALDNLLKREIPD
jgi:hypothetical protein